MHEVLVNRLGGLSLPRKSVVRLTDRPNMTLDVYRGRKTTMQLQLEHKRGSIAYSLSLSPDHCPDMNEILLKRMLNHKSSIHPSSSVGQVLAC